LQRDLGSEFLAIISTNLGTFAYAWLRVLFFRDKKKLRDGVTGRRRRAATFILSFNGKHVLEEISFQQLASLENDDNIILHHVDIRLSSDTTCHSSINKQSLCRTD
jgi:hypothetical protein